MAVRKARVWNDHTRSYSEIFRDGELTIPAKGYVDMEEPEAVLFMGQYAPVKRDGHGNDLVPKMLRLEILDGSQTERPEFRCMSCNKVTMTAADLELHVHDAHKDVMLDDDAKKKVTRK